MSKMSFPVFLKSFKAEVYYKLISPHEMVSIFDTVDQKTIEHFITVNMLPAYDMYVRNIRVDRDNNTEYSRSYERIDRIQFDNVFYKVHFHLKQINNLVLENKEV